MYMARWYGCEARGQRCAWQCQYRKRSISAPKNKLFASIFSTWCRFVLATSSQRLCKPEHKQHHKYASSIICTCNIRLFSFEHPFCKGLPWSSSVWLTLHKMFNHEPWYTQFDVTNCTLRVTLQGPLQYKWRNLCTKILWQRGAVCHAASRRSLSSHVATYWAISSNQYFLLRAPIPLTQISNHSETFISESWQLRNPIVQLYLHMHQFVLCVWSIV